MSAKLAQLQKLWQRANFKARTCIAARILWRQVIGISTRHLRRLTVEGILPLVPRNGKKPRYRLDESVQRYLKYQKDYVVATMSQTDSDYRVARTRRMLALAVGEELQVKLKKGELLHRDDVEFWITNALTAFKSRIQAIPARVARLVLGQTSFKVVHDAIATETDLALNELSTLTIGPDSAAFLAGQAARTEATDDDESNESVE